EAIRYMEGLLPGGWPELRERNRALIIQARNLLCKRLGVSAPCPEEMLGSMATLPLPAEFQELPKTSKIDPDQMRLYDEFRIEVPFNRFGQPERRWFRISAQFYNCVEEYDYLAEALLRLTRPS